MSKKKSHVLVIGGKDHTYKRILDLGYRFSAIQIPALVTDYQKNSASHYLISDYKAVDMCMSLAKALYAHDPFNCVVSFSEFSQLASAAIALELGVASNCDLNAIKVTRDKNLFRQILKDTRLQSVPSTTINSRSDLELFLRDCGGPVVLKPASGAGSEGVYFLDAVQGIDDALTHCRNANMGEALAEKFIPGLEYSVETLSIDSYHELIMVTEKYTSGPPHFVELGHIQPAKISSIVWQEIHDAVVCMLDKVGHVTGPAHTEVKVWQDQVYLIETQLRFGGDQIWEMTSRVSGVDLVNETVTVLMQGDKQDRNAEFSSMAIAFLRDAVDRLSIQKILQGLDLEKYVIRVEIEEETEQQKVTHSGERFGYVLFGCKTRAARLEIAPLLKKLEGQNSA